MRDNYFISIEGKQDFSTDNSVVRVETVGTYVKKGNLDYIIYREYDDENPKKYSTSMLKVDNEDCVTLIKNGENRTKLILEKGKRHHCCYNTEIGSIMVGVFTDKIVSNLSDNGGELKISYSLDINTSLASVNEIVVKIRRMD